MSKPWIQAAIDVNDIDLAKRIAFMALDNGAEWLEVGTPLLYQYGYEAIGMLRKAVGKDKTLVADYKSPFAMLCVPQAAEQGINYVMLSAGYNDWALDNNIMTCEKYGIKPIFDMAVKPCDMRQEIDKLVRHGAEYIFTRHYAATLDDSNQLNKMDLFPSVSEGNKQYMLGITSDNLEEAVDAVKKGADWITFGWVLRNPDPKVCREWIDTIHSARKEK